MPHDAQGRASLVKKTLKINQLTDDEIFSWTIWTDMLEENYRSVIAWKVIYYRKKTFHTTSLTKKLPQPQATDVARKMATFVYCTFRFIIN